MLLTPGAAWTCVPIRRIEDLRDAVLGAGLEATQMSRGGFSGGLAFSQRDGIVSTSGLIGGRVALRGPLSQDMLTIGIGLDVAPGTTHWHRERQTGNIVVFFPGDEHSALYTPGSLYATVNVTAERLEEEAARENLVLDAKSLGGTGFHPRLMDPKVIATLRDRMRRMHGGIGTPGDAAIGRIMLLAAIRHLGRQPRARTTGAEPGLHGRIVERARDYIAAHLAEPMTVDEIAAAAFTSRRTLFRAFADLLDDTARGYVRRLRLHRIHHDLASEAEASCTVALVANRWGLSELGRVAGLYCDLFGELPGETRARRRGQSGTRRIDHPALEAVLSP
ncbi:MAG: helix-turn-helix transcriptional regulator [Rhodobacteraceae bacterium]|nr:helix-turn-helix transcriptional regulator [Paracoccaceae bacterium]